MLSFFTAIGLYKGVAFIRKASNLKDNLSVNVTPKAFSLLNLTTVKSIISATLTNYSGFNLNVSNVYSKLNLIENGGGISEAGVSSVIPKINFKNNESKGFDLAFNLSYLSIVGKILTGKVKEIQVVTFYDFGGQQLSYKSSIDLASFISKAKAFVSGNKSMSGGIGML